LSRQPEKIPAFKALVNEYFESIALPRQPGSLYDPIRYTLEGNGKRLRPVLVLLACEAVGGKVVAALPAAAAIELLHNFTLVHDDIMDRDDTRRGRPTVHRKWDSDVALLAGDGLVALAYQHLLKTDTPRLAQIARLFTDGIIELCEGQALDREFEQAAHVSMADYLAMISKKTARLLAISAGMGGMIGGGNERQVALLTEYAENLGIAFQIQDDLLDITVEQKVLGKDFGSDIKRHKRTYLVIHALEHGAATQQRHLREALGTPNLTTDEVLNVRKIFEETGALSSATRAVRDYIARSRSALDALAASAEVGGLQMLLDVVLKRNA
jgi:geranylgeranyl diphosphate synthase type II